MDSAVQLSNRAIKFKKSTNCGLGFLYLTYSDSFGYSTRDATDVVLQ
jgi:hypothetical protein